VNTATSGARGCDRWPLTAFSTPWRNSGSLFACNPATQRLVSTKISADTKGEKIAYVNGRTVIVGSNAQVGRAHRIRC
jgi:hypothetical protein